jgi:hypothetical protein
MADIQDRKFASLGLQKTISHAGIVSYNKNLNTANANNPILVLLHGYPQSAYMYGFSFADT